MADAALDQITTRSPAEIARAAGLSPEAAALLEAQESAGQGLDLLADRGLFPEAINYLAHALPKQEALWWACQCVRVLPPPPPGPFTEALEVAEKFAADPSEEHRRQAQATTQSAGPEHPAYCLALAAFLSQGSLAPAGLPEVPPPEGVAARAVAGAVLLAAVQDPPQQASERFARFLEIGRAVAAGTNRWAEAQPAAPRAAPAASPAQAPAAPPDRPVSPFRAATKKRDTWE